MEFIYFLGRFHVLLLHLPIGILTLAVVFEVLVRLKPFRALEVAIASTWIAGAVSAVGTVALGYMHATESGFRGSAAVEAHRWAGVLLALSACAIAVMRLRLGAIATWPKWAASAAPAYDRARTIFAPGGQLDRLYSRAGWAIACAATVFLLFMTGHLGGNLTHGETYLVEYAPTPLRQLAGLSAEAGPRAKPADLASADIYLDVVGPALQQRCASCHNDGKRGGGLSVANHTALIKGGTDGPVIVAGNASNSDLFRRISLPSDHEDYMPKDGKTPLTDQQVAIIGWWISQGAPATATVATLKPTPEVQTALAQALGLAGGDIQLSSGPAAGRPVAQGGVPAPRDEPLPNVAPADPAAVTALEATGFVVRPVVKGSNLVSVDYTATRGLAAQDLANLGKLGPQILRLNLRRSGVTDSQLETISAFPNVRRLRLEDNPITDAGVGALQRLIHLQSLTLHRTKITDSGLAALEGLPGLKEVYVWQSQVTEAAASRFRAKNPDILLDTGLTPADVPKDVRVIPPTS